MLLNREACLAWRAYCFREAIHVRQRQPVFWRYAYNGDSQIAVDPFDRFNRSCWILCNSVSIGQDGPLLPALVVGSNGHSPKVASKFHSHALSATFGPSTATSPADYHAAQLAGHQNLALKTAIEAESIQEKPLLLTQKAVQRSGSGHFIFGAFVRMLFETRQAPGAKT